MLFSLLLPERLWPVGMERGLFYFSSTRRLSHSEGHKFIFGLFVGFLERYERGIQDSGRAVTRSKSTAVLTWLPPEKHPGENHHFIVVAVVKNSLRRAIWGEQCFGFSEVTSAWDDRPLELNKRTAVEGWQPPLGTGVFTFRTERKENCYFLTFFLFQQGFKSPQGHKTHSAHRQACGNFPLKEEKQNERYIFFTKQKLYGIPRAPNAESLFKNTFSVECKSSCWSAFPRPWVALLLLLLLPHETLCCRCNKATERITHFNGSVADKKWIILLLFFSQCGSQHAVVWICVEGVTVLSRHSYRKHKHVNLQRINQA